MNFRDRADILFSLTDYLKTMTANSSSATGRSILLYPTTYKEQKIKRLVIGDSENTTNKSNIKVILT